MTRKRLGSPRPVASPPGGGWIRRVPRAAQPPAPQRRSRHCRGNHGRPRFPRAARQGRPPWSGAGEVKPWVGETRRKKRMLLGEAAPRAPADVRPLRGAGNPRGPDAGRQKRGRRRGRARARGGLAAGVPGPGHPLFHISPRLVSVFPSQHSSLTGDSETTSLRVARH